MLHGNNLIKKIENTPNSENLRLIYVELQYLQQDLNKFQNSIDEICNLINLVGKFLIHGEKRKDLVGCEIFDCFGELDFLSEFAILSSYDNYNINLEIINTFSFLMININTKSYLYYLFSGNTLNKIINKDPSQYDDEYLSYYINFLKSLSLRLDETTINLFYLEKLNSFPLIENALEFYNHEDSMVRSVVRNIVLNILKIKEKDIQKYFMKLPSIAYFSDLVCHLRDICLNINEELMSKDINKINYIFDDLVDETMYIDDLLNLNLQNINYILLNNLFYYLITPIIFGSICLKNNSLPKNLALFFLVFFLLNIKNETFKNIIITLIFSDVMLNDVEYYLTNIPEKNYYHYKKTNFQSGKCISFLDFVSQNYTQEFFNSICKENNIYLYKYGKKYFQLNDILEKIKKIQKELETENSGNISPQLINKVIKSFISESDIKKMNEYHKSICMSSGICVGRYDKEDKGNIFTTCFLGFVSELLACLNYDFVSNHKIDIKTKNLIKTNFLNLFDIKDEKILILMNIFLFIIQSKENKISFELLNFFGMKREIDDSEICIKNYQLNVEETPNKKTHCLNTIFFIYDNEYFRKFNFYKSEITDNIKIFEKLSNILLYDLDYLPITIELICYNISNLLNGMQNIKSTDITEGILDNIHAKYKEYLFLVYSYINDTENNAIKGYNIFLNQWQKYKNMSNKKMFELIKSNLMNSCNILITNNNKINDCPDIIKYLKALSEEEILSNRIFIFMILHDTKEIITNKFSHINNITCKNHINKLIKDQFPLDFSYKNFKIDEEYDISEFDSNEIYRQQIEYKFIEEEKFSKGELVIYREFAYFCISTDKNIIKIDLIYPLKCIILLENNENLLEFIVIKRDLKQKAELIMKFKNKEIRNKTENFINNKIESCKDVNINNFLEYFEGLVKTLKKHKTKSRPKSLIKSRTNKRVFDTHKFFWFK